MPIEYDTEEIARKYCGFTSCDGYEYRLFSLSGILNYRFGLHPFSGPDRFQKFYTRRGKNDCGIIDSYHGRVIGKSEDKSTMNEIPVIDNHLLCSGKSHTAVTNPCLKRDPA